MLSGFLNKKKKKNMISSKFSQSIDPHVMRQFPPENVGPIITTKFFIIGNSHIIKIDPLLLPLAPYRVISERGQMNPNILAIKSIIPYLSPIQNNDHCPSTFYILNQWNSFSK